MRCYKLLIPALCLFFLIGCASKNKAVTDTSHSAAETSESAKQKTKSVSDSREAKSKEAAELEIVGKPAPNSKFAKLKPGMTVKQVVAIIGQPDNQWQRPTGKSQIPFYFGDDRWVLEYAYKKEGKLTFNYGGDQVLTSIVVDTSE